MRVSAIAVVIAPFDCLEDKGRRGSHIPIHATPRYVRQHYPVVRVPRHGFCLQALGVNRMQ